MSNILDQVAIDNEALQNEVKSMNHVGTSLLRLTMAQATRVLSWAEVLVEGVMARRAENPPVDATTLTFELDGHGHCVEIGGLALLLRTLMSSRIITNGDVAQPTGIGDVAEALKQNPAIIQALALGTLRKIDESLAQQLANYFSVPVNVILAAAGMPLASPTMDIAQAPSTPTPQPAPPAQA